MRLAKFIASHEEEGMKNRRGRTPRLPSRTLVAVIGSLLAIFLALQGSRAEQSKDPSAARSAPNTLADELQPLAYFQGSWTCEGVFPGSGKPIASNLHFSSGLEGAWLAVQSDDAPPNRFHARELWGYDKSAKRFRNFIFDNFGGARLFTFPGWDGDKLVWTGDAFANTDAPAQRFIFEKTSPQEFVVSWEVRKPQADWAVGDRLTCRKAKTLAAVPEK
jgi:hypothetical protein